MPLHCCVPLCTRKGYRSDVGENISYFSFPKADDLKKKWIHAIRRNESSEFSISARHTKVCSRHFRADDLKQSLNGIVTLKVGAVPSKFVWSGSSPMKRKPPKQRVSFPPPTSQYMEECEVDSLPCSSSNVMVNEPGTSHSNEVENEESLKRIEKMKSELQQALEENQKLKKYIVSLEFKATKAESLVFKLEHFTSDKDMALYTGFSNYATFKAVFDFLCPNGDNIRYCTETKDRTVPVNYYEPNEDDDDDDDLFDELKKQIGRPRALQPMEEFFLVLCRLRRGFSEAHLGHLFGITQSSVSRIFITWINYMYLKFGNVSIWPAKHIIQDTMPEDFKEKYGSTRVIIDCTEVRCQMPSSLLLNSKLFSSYKNHVTLKALVGIAPSGATTFISQLYTGNISDREIVIHSGFLNLKYDIGDSVMADKGFTIEDLLPLGVKLNIPPFLGGDKQMEAEDVIKTQQIAGLRIHVERAINKIKNFHFWDGVVPLSLFGVVNQMWSVCSFLCNVHDPLISA